MRSRFLMSSRASKEALLHRLALTFIRHAIKSRLPVLGLRNFQLGTSPQSLTRHGDRVRLQRPVDPSSSSQHRANFEPQADTWQLFSWLCSGHLQRACAWPYSSRLGSTARGLAPTAAPGRGGAGRFRKVPGLRRRCGVLHFLGGRSDLLEPHLPPCPHRTSTARSMGPA